MKRATSGFTVIELAITLAVGAIAIVIAVPSLTGMIQSNRLTGATNSLVTALNYARAEAIRRGTPIAVTATVGTDWATGLTVADGITVLRTFPATGGGVTMNSGAVNQFVFTALGRITVPGSVIVCDNQRSGETGRTIDILRTGRIAVTNSACP